jgi:hypothetical protein
MRKDFSTRNDVSVLVVDIQLYCAPIEYKCQESIRVRNVITVECSQDEDRCSSLHSMMIHLMTAKCLYSIPVVSFRSRLFGHFSVAVVGRECLG